MGSTVPLAVKSRPVTTLFFYDYSVIYFLNQLFGLEKWLEWQEI